MRTNRIIKSLPFILLMVLLCNSVFAKEKVLLPLGFNQTWSARLLFNSEGGYSGYMNNEENSIHGWSKLYEAQENDAYSISMPTKVSNVEHGRVQFKTPITLLSNHSYRFQATLYADKSVPELLLQLSENENDNSVFFSQTLSIEAGKSINISSTGLRGTDIEDMKLALYIATEEENTTIILSGIRLYDETEQKEIWVGTSYYNYCYYWYEVGRYRIKDMVIDGRVETLSWADANFDDSMWKEAEMPIGERGYMSEVKTEWPGGDNTNFWIRRDFELDELNESASYYVLVCHDDTYSIYVNGHLIDSQIDWTSGKDYKTLEVPVQYLNVGKNVIATYIQQNWGGKFYDCGMKIVEKNILIYDEGTSADGSEGIDKLFDDDTSTKWCNVNYDSPRYVIFHSPEPIVVTGYEITTANDAESYSERNPRSWTLYGFDGAYNPGKDADAWEVIASITNDTLLQAANFATSTYTLPAPTSKAYQYFMWVITEPSEHFVQVSEFFLKYTKKSVSPGEFQGAKRIFGDNLLKSSTNDDKTFTYHYDGNGFVTQIDRVKSSGSSKTYTITYGDKIVVNCSDGNRWTATMNSQGFIAAMDYKDDKGNAEHVTFTYNDNNQLSKVDYGDGDVFTLTYTDGNITRVTNYDDVIDFGYESSGQGRISNTGKVMEFGRIYGIDMDDFNLLYYIGALGYPTKHLPLYGIVDGATITGSWTTDDAGRAIKAQFSNRNLSWNWDNEGSGQGGEDLNPLLLGTWRYDFDTNSYILLTFSQDGTVHYKEYDKGGWQHDEVYRYSFNNNALKITDSNENVKGVIEVLTLTSTTLKLKDWPDGGVSTFTKQNGSDIESAVLNGSIIGQWNIVSGSYTRYENDVQVSQETGTFTPSYDKIAFYDNGTVEFLEYSNSNNSYHEDGQGTYSIRDNKFVYGGGDWDSFIITAFDGSNNMEVYFQFSEDKGSTFVRKVYYVNLQRVTDGGDDPMPAGEFLGAKRIFADNLLKSSTNDDKTFTYHYDSNGFVTQIDRVKSSGSSKTYTITYGDKIVVNCSDGNRWTATVESHGFIGAMDYKDDKGNAEHVTFTYNDNNQLSKVDYGDGDVFTLTYTDGNITRVTNYYDVIDFGYESSGQGRISNTGKVMEFGRIYGIDMDDFNLLYYIGALGYPTKHLPLYGIVDGATITGSWTTDDAGRAIKAQFSNRSLTWNWDDNGGGQGGEQDFQTDNTLSFADNMKTNAGSEFTLPIMMTNKDAISGVQFDLYLPKGIEVCKDEYEDYLIELSRTTIRRHSIASRVMPDGALRVVISSTQNSTFTGNSGQLLSLLLLANSTLEAGNYEVMLKNIVLTDPDAKRYVVADVKSYINVKKYTLGDVNNDGYIDVADLAGVVRFILENADASLIFNAADMDGNGVVEINDYAALVNVILNQSTPSAALKRRANSLRNTLVTLSDYRQNTQGEGELMVHIGSNGMLFTGMQFDLRLPEGVELMEEGTEAISIQHETCMQKLANGKYRVICASITNNELPEGDVVRLKLRVANDVDNILEFMADNIVLSDVNAIRHEASPVNIAINMDDATGIVDLSSTFSGSNGTIYDLCGRKIISQFTIFNSQLSKGIYIVNGKKVSLK